MLSQCIYYTLETYQILSPILFQQSPLLIHRIFFYLSLLFFYMLCSIRREDSSRSFALPKKCLFSMVTWGIIKCARTYVCTYGAGAEYSSCKKFFDTILTVQSAKRTCSNKTACLNILCLLSMVLKTRGLGTGAIFIRGQLRT